MHTPVYQESNRAISVGSKWDDMEKWVSRINRNTSVLRSARGEMYVRIKTLLKERGIDIDHILVVNIMEEDSYMESGIVVTPDMKVFEFEYYFRNTPHSQAAFSAWTDLTATYHTRAFRVPIAVALEMMRSKTQPHGSAAAQRH